MRFFLRYFLLLIAMLAAVTFYLPIRYSTSYPAQPGPQFDAEVRNQPIRLMDENHIQVALVGDSALEESVDEQALSTALEKPSHVIFVPGSTSAFWYLVIKNIVLETEKKPEYLIIFFRDTILTLPNFHVNGGYVHEIDQFATAHEDFLLEHAYLNFMNPLEKWALTYFPLYSSREQVTETVNYYARNILPSLVLTCTRECIDRALAVIFQVDNVRKDIRAVTLEREQDVLFTRQAMGFESSIDSSFLPEIIRITRENGLRLILVNERTLLFPSEAAEPEALRAYKDALALYLKENDVALLDFSYDLRLPPSYFSDSLHMNETGKAAFTQMLAEALKPLIRAGQ
jgi:hypothetical protein